MFKLMYVFDPREAEGYVCRVPEFVARIIARCTQLGLDYAPTPEGL
jgi:hypothetical protein